jgi:L-threonate 2-dehydrogenase
MALTGIGLAGCGRMGAPMLAALRHHGFDATGFDIKPLADPQTGITTNPETFERGLTTLITVVRDIDETEQVLFRDQGFVKRAPNLNTVIICSTVSPNYIADLAARLPSQITLVDAPMSGATVAAQNRQLSFMLGGADAVLDHLQPLFAAMGSSFHRMGPLGSGMSAKVLNNLLAASNTVMTRLVLDWAQARGLNEQALLALIAASSGQNWFASAFQSIEFARDGYAPDNTIGILKKDVQSSLDAAPEGADGRLPQLLIELIGTLRPK